MRKNHPRGTYRDPEEHYDLVYDFFPDQQEVSRIIDHRRKLTTVNLCANPAIAQPLDIRYDSHVPAFYREDA